VSRTGKSLTGTARYASVNTHLGLEQGRRDDLEGLVYVLLYFLRGSLPWQGLQAANQKDKYHKICLKKQNTPVRELCKGLPPEFGTLLCYCRNLKFDEAPNYNYCRKLLREVFEQNNFTMDYVYDWTVKQNEGSSALAASRSNEEEAMRSANHGGKENPPESSQEAQASTMKPERSNPTGDGRQAVGQAPDSRQLENNTGKRGGAGIQGDQSGQGRSSGAKRLLTPGAGDSKTDAIQCKTQ